MIYDRMIITSYIQLHLKLQTSDGISHAIVTQYSNEMDQIISRGLEYTAGLIRNFEQEKKAEIVRIGK